MCIWRLYFLPDCLRAAQGKNFSDHHANGKHAHIMISDLYTKQQSRGGGRDGSGVGRGVASGSEGTERAWRGGRGESRRIVALEEAGSAAERDFSGGGGTGFKISINTSTGERAIGARGGGNGGGGRGKSR